MNEIIDPYTHLTDKKKCVSTLFSYDKPLKESQM